MIDFKLRYFILVIILIVSWGLTYSIKNNQPKFSKGEDIIVLPLTFEGWIGNELSVDKQTKEILQTNSVLMSEYKNPNRKDIALTIVYYKDSRTAFHLPESCLLGHGSRLVDKNIELINNPGGTNFYVNKLKIQKGMKKHIVLYYFETRKFKTSSYFEFRKKILLGKLKGESTSGALVKFVIETEENSFLEDLRILKKFIVGIGELLSNQLI